MILRLLKSKLNTIDDFLTEDSIKSLVKDAVDDWFTNNSKTIYSNSSDYICDQIVEESYIKYDGSSLYMPILIFKYKNKKIVNKRKYAQIKIRLNLSNDEITDQIVENLKLKVMAGGC